MAVFINNSLSILLQPLCSIFHPPLNEKLTRLMLRHLFFATSFYIHPEIFKYQKDDPHNLNFPDPHADFYIIL